MCCKALLLVFNLLKEVENESINSDSLVGHRCIGCRSLPSGNRSECGGEEKCHSHRLPAKRGRSQRVLHYGRRREELRLDDAVDLGKHVGHKVTVTGTFKAESYEKEKGEKEANEKKEAPEAGDIRVTSLKMVSDSCK